MSSAPTGPAACAGAAKAVLAAGSAKPAPGPAAQPTFITTWSCPYAQRSWIALNEKGVDYKPVFVDLKSKPDWFFGWNPYGRVPTLAWTDGGEEHSLYESLVVNEYVDDAFPGPPLLPPTPAGRAQARLLIDQFGAKFGSAFAKVMFGAPGDADAKAALDDAVAWLDGALHPEGPYACGAAFTLADAAMAPFALRLPLLKELAGYAPPPAARRFDAWCAAAAARPSVAASMVPPEMGSSYSEQLIEVYKHYVAERRAAAAK